LPTPPSNERQEIWLECETPETADALWVALAGVPGIEAVPLLSKGGPIDARKIIVITVASVAAATLASRAIDALG
jgi:hypothetical protein